VERVTGIGGLFFKAKDLDGLARWYQQHLGIDPVPQSYDATVWEQRAGPTVFAPFEADRNYFGRGAQWFQP
jgi:glyoxylase I family protein